MKYEGVLLMMNWNEFFYYDETSPTCLRWKVERRGGRNKCIVIVNIGDVAGNFQNQLNGNPAPSPVMLNCKAYGTHRVIWEMFNGTIPKGMVIDHLDGNPRNNKISNLALKTQAENTRNTRMQKNNTSGTTGVSLQGGEDGYWVAHWMGEDGTLKRKLFSIKKLGYNEAFSEAIRTRDEAIENLNILGFNYTNTHGKRNK